MASLSDSFREFVTSTPAEASAARQSSDALALILNETSASDATVDVQVGGKTVSLPVGALHLLHDILSGLGQGHGVTVLSTDAELTTQQAADLLNVSRPFLVEQLESGLLPFRKVGTHRRVLLRDVLKYKRATDEKRLRALDELAAQAQDLNMGY